MDINVTLIGQMIAFAMFIFVTMRYIWPPILNALDERQKRIAEGLQAAERSENELKLSQKNIADQLREAKHQATEIIEHANQRAVRIVEEGKEIADKEGKRLLEMAQNDIEQERLSVRDVLMKELSEITIQGVEKILQKNIDHATHSRLVDQLIAEIPGA
ncbi:MAG: F0F1 ATP synthase subunit B [Gammaproteobacteria bacterium]|nr:F0F1 ATP synthase subunit B [Gammaproteobacteria bacterium]